MLVHKNTPHELLPQFNLINEHVSLHWFRIQLPQTSNSSSTAPPNQYTLTVFTIQITKLPTTIWKAVYKCIKKATIQYPNIGLVLIGDFNTRLLECGDVGGHASSHPFHEYLLSPLRLRIVNSILAYGEHTHSCSSDSGQQSLFLNHAPAPAPSSYHDVPSMRSSVLDLAICNFIILNQCESLVVEDRKLFASDHKAIRLILQSSTD